MSPLEILQMNPPTLHLSAAPEDSYTLSVAAATLSALRLFTSDGPHATQIRARHFSWHSPSAHPSELHLPVWEAEGIYLACKPGEHSGRIRVSWATARSLTHLQGLMGNDPALGRGPLLRGTPFRAPFFLYGRRPRHLPEQLATCLLCLDFFCSSR